MNTAAYGQVVNDKLLTYLEKNISGFKGPARMEKFSGGQSNPTYKLTAASGLYVLRRQPPGKLLKSAHAVDREYHVQDALRNSDVPVARVLHLCSDKKVLGSMFYIMDYCDGRIFWDARLPELDTNTDRAGIYEEMNRVMADLHRVDIDAAGLSAYGKPGNYFARQLKRWTDQYRASELTVIPAMEDLISWLENNRPDDDGRVALVHGDYRLDNLVFHHRRAEIIAVLDWELSTLGHPFADLAYQCMQLRMPAGNARPAGLKGLDRAALGIPSETEYVARYCERMNIDRIDHWAFYLSFSFFRLASIVQGVAKRALQGNASNQEAAALGRWVEPLANEALAVISADRAG